jgi:hypothetical protein
MRSSDKYKKLSEAYVSKRMAERFSKSQKILDDKTLSSIEALSKLKYPLSEKNLFSKYKMPQTSIDKIASVNKQFGQLLSEIYVKKNAFRIQPPLLAQINDLNYSFSDISNQVAKFAMQQRNWGIIDDFREVSEQAIEFSESLTEDVTEEQEKQFQSLLKLVSAFVKEYGISGLLIIDIILRFAGIHQYYDFLKDKPELATKQEINQISTKQDSVIHYINLVNEQLKEQKEYRITNRNCEVKLKPKSNTTLLTKLPEGYEATVIRIHHKWVYVSYFDPKDNLPQTGWIMKKYLDKPK